MALTIRYTDTKHQHEVQCDEIQTTCIVKAVQSRMHPLMLSRPEYCDFDLMHIDLRSESVEEVHCYKNGSRIASFGGAIAWEIYRQTAEVWPTINYYVPCFTGGAEHTS